MKNIFKIIAAAGIVCLAASCEKAPKGPTDHSGGCEAVDLGLSVKWASFNVGATSAEGRGLYFAWGETSDKSNYDWTHAGDYLWGVYDIEADPICGMTKYTSHFVGGDGLKKLLDVDDPATVNWGTKWRTPSNDEFAELRDGTKCEWTWDATKKGYTVRSLSTGNTIFLPAAGYRKGTELFNDDSFGHYWTSTLDEEYPESALFILFNSDFHSSNSSFRLNGRTIRAVTEY